MKDKTKIEISKDYDKFKFINGNRPVDDRHVNKLVASMKQHYVPTPIIVNSKNQMVCVLSIKILRTGHLMIL